MSDALLRARVMAKVANDASSGCWLWTGARSSNGGYARVAVGGRNRRAHRVVYELLVGPIPAGLTLDHLCRTPRCVNPDHLEPVTNTENIMRGDGWAARNARKTCCPRGHTYTVTKRGHRCCYTCANAAQRARRAARRAR